MHNNDLPLARRDIIALRLEQGQGAVAAALAVEFGVSEDAIRRDLRALAAAGRCRRVYGGALPLAQDVPVSPASSPMAVRVDENAGRKLALARTAATLVQPGECVFLDNGSSNLALVRFLPRNASLIIATSSIQIAAEVLQRSDLQLVMVGGTVDANVGGSVDAYAVQQLGLLNIDRCFLGACAVAAGSGIAAFDAADANFKRALLAASTHSVVMATSDKLETRAPYRIAAVAHIGQLIVEHDATIVTLAALVQAGAAILSAAAPSPAVPAVPLSP